VQDSGFSPIVQNQLIFGVQFEQKCSSYNHFHFQFLTIKPLRQNKVIWPFFTHPASQNCISMKCKLSLKDLNSFYAVRSTCGIYSRISNNYGIFQQLSERGLLTPWSYQMRESLALLPYAICATDMLMIVYYMFGFFSFSQMHSFKEQWW
jgi:hypothetical protein